MAPDRQRRKVLTDVLGLHEFVPSVNVSALLEDHQLLREVQCNVLRHTVMGHEELLEFAGAGRVVASRDIVV